MNDFFPATRRGLLKASAALALPAAGFSLSAAGATKDTPLAPRERLSINHGWRFRKDDPDGGATLLYDVRDVLPGARSEDLKHSPIRLAADVSADAVLLKPHLLPCANQFIGNAADRHRRPAGNPGGDLPFVQPGFDDGGWQAVDLPHDWAIAGPFLEKGPYGGMGRLPSWGVGWYRRRLDITASDAGRSIFLDIDGAMAYAAVWLNGQFVGGWPYGWNSWRVDLTPYLDPGGDNVAAIRLHNPPDSCRWYPGAGLYRNVWLTKVDRVHVGQWGTQLTTPRVSEATATVALTVTVDNLSAATASVHAVTEIAPIEGGGGSGNVVARIDHGTANVAPNGSVRLSGSTIIAKPRLWGPPPTQQPNRYCAITTISRDGEVVDRYATPFGIRAVRFEADRGIFINDELVPLRGVDRHGDFGALGTAYNDGAARRQLGELREMGCNALRMSHNPPAPEFLDLCDELGFLVLDEIFDCWEIRKTPLDFHLIFSEWHEADLRAMLRRDRNHPSIFLWSIGNEVLEQQSGEAGAAIARRLVAIVREEDAVRPVTSAMNSAKPDQPMPGAIDVIGLNYQGIGVRTIPGQFAPFHEKFPNKVIFSTESAAALSSRGAYQFPVSGAVSAPVRPGVGGDPETRQVSAYELYAADFGTSADEVFSQEDQHPFVAGEFVWTGWDYLGEPTPYYSSRSSYFGIIDLAGFRKDRFYLYQARWRPDLAMVHILPHWTWPGREGQVTPVHVFTAGDEVELFVNGKSQGRRKRAPFQYRFRWDYVTYQPGELKAVAYKDGKIWATETVRTAGLPVRLTAVADRSRIVVDDTDLAFVSVCAVDGDGTMVPTATNVVHFHVTGPGDLIATDNGDPTDFTAFSSVRRALFAGRALAIVRAKPDGIGNLRITAQADGLANGGAIITAAAG